MVEASSPRPAAIGRLGQRSSRTFQTGQNCSMELEDFALADRLPDAVSKAYRPAQVQAHSQQQHQPFDVSQLSSLLGQTQLQSPAAAQGWAASFLGQQQRELGPAMTQRQREEMGRIYENVQRAPQMGEAPILCERS